MMLQSFNRQHKTVNMKAKDLLNRIEEVQAKADTMSTDELLKEMSQIPDEVNLILDGWIEKYIK